LPVRSGEVRPRVWPEGQSSCAGGPPVLRRRCSQYSEPRPVPQGTIVPKFAGHAQGPRLGATPSSPGLKSGLTAQVHWKWTAPQSASSRLQLSAGNSFPGVGFPRRPFPRRPFPRRPCPRPPSGVALPGGTAGSMHDTPQAHEGHAGSARHDPARLVASLFRQLHRLAGAIRSIRFPNPLTAIRSPNPLTML
jgi:hypothetical protein